MKLRASRQTCSGLTLFELIIVVVILLVLFAMLVPSSGSHRKGPKIHCMNNLKQIGIAYYVWTGDHGDQFPMELSVTNGGTMELMNTADAWRAYQVMSNELSTPKILYCPADDERPMPATNFSADLKGKISYFIGLSVLTNLPSSFLSGDDNFSITSQPVKPGLINLTSNTPVAWTRARHNLSGNIGMGDGSVQSSTCSGLIQYLNQTGLATDRLAILP